MLIAAKSQEEIRTIKAQLNNEFEVKVLGSSQKYTWDGDFEGESGRKIILESERIY